MPAQGDKESAGLRFEGEAQRLNLRRPRLDRDGLYLFGRRYAAQVVTLGEDDLLALRRGRVIAVDVLGEYLLYMRLDSGLQGDERTSAESGRGNSGCEAVRRNVPQRERPDQPPSDRVRAVAALVRVNADQGAGFETPAWIRALAQTDVSRPGQPSQRNPEPGDLFDDATMVTGLRELLGAKLTAYLASAGTTRTVRGWADGRDAPSYEVSNRMRFAYRIAILLNRRDPVSVVQAWFTGLNSALDERSPAALIREGDLNEYADRVLDAAKHFAADE